jgi:NAD(P)-dependent dehydrogenase (short-subunit alcohol dehydrogenase family)
MEFGDRVCVVTGAASGIGRATAVALAGEGADVAVCDIDAGGARACADQIEALGRRSLVLQADLGRRAEVERMVDASIAWRGRCDLFVSNAGVGCRGPAHAFSVGEWEEILAIDLMASIWAIRLLVPHMLERGSGHIAFVSSGQGLEGFAGYAPYAVAKFGLIGLGEALARELAGTGVRVSIVVPGAVATSGWKTYRFAGGEALDAAEVERRRSEIRADGAGWPSPDSMAATIVDGLRDDRVYILQKNPAVQDWYGDLMRRRADDPDGFVLGS